jgi:predicted alpha/beta hydrolase family esterase
MTRQVLFIQGGGEGTHDAWDNRLVDSLRRELGPGYEIRYPRMPNEADPSYAAWKAAIAEEIAGLVDGAVVVGHSLGGTILINALAEAPPKQTLAGLFLVAAPFVGPGGWPSDDVGSMGDLGTRLPPNVPIHLYFGGEDDTVPLTHAELYERAIPGATVHRLPGRDHQLGDDLTELAADIHALSLREQIRNRHSWGPNNRPFPKGGAPRRANILLVVQCTI